MGRIASPATPSASRLVTTMRTVEQTWTRASASSAAAVRTGSQSSRTRRSRLPLSWSTIVDSSERPAGSGRPIALTTDGNRKLGSLRLPHSTTHVPSSNRSRSVLARRRPIRVLPTPPGPVSVSKRGLIEHPRRLFDLTVATDETRDLELDVVPWRIPRAWRREVTGQARPGDLIEPLRRAIERPQPMRSEVDGTQRWAEVFGDEVARGL